MVKIAVIGAGIVGLTTAVHVQKELPLCDVTIIADKFLQETTSDAAAGIHRPTPDHVDGVSEEQLREWYQSAVDHYLEIIHTSPTGGASGVMQVSGYFFKELTEFKDVFVNLSPLTEKETAVWGPDYKDGWFATTVMTEPRKHMPVLTNIFQKNGGIIERRTVNSLDELSPEFDIVVNCAALGNQQLTNDTQMYPVRGQVIRIKAPWIKHFYYFKDGTYVLPNCDNVVIGGVRNRDDYGTDVRPTDAKWIWDRVCSHLPSIKHAEIDYHRAGIRPHRTTIRVEKEDFPADGKVLKVVHNYGHGAHGIALAWGTAVDAVKLVKQSITEIRQSPISKL